MAKMHIKKGDTVQVISGKDKGKKGEVLRVYPSENRVSVKDVAMMSKHKKPTQMMQQGGIIRMEGKIHASNVLLYCDSCAKGVRTGIKVLEDGSKTRLSKKCDKTLGGK